MMKNLPEYLISYVAMILTFLMLNVVVCCVSHKYIDGNLRESLCTLSEEGRFPWLWGNVLWAKDNVSDGTMYNIAVSGYGMNPLEEAIINPRTMKNSEEEINPADFGLMAIDTKDDSVDRYPYGRYWNGYQVPLRVASLFFDIRGMRIVNSIILWLLLFYTTMLLYRRFNICVSAGWFVSFILMGFIAVPLSLQYIGCFYILFGTVILMLHKPELMRNYLFYFIVGGVTSYIDLLTVPLLTISIPLVIIVLCNSQVSYKRLIVTIVSWFAGYSSIWITKWVLYIMLVGEDSISGIVDSCEAHTIIPFLPEGIGHKYFWITCGLLGIVLISDLIVYVTKRVKSTRVNQLFCISIMPFVWYVFFLGHTVVHIWFVYRNLVVTIFCCWLIMFYNKINQNHGDRRSHSLL